MKSLSILLVAPLLLVLLGCSPEGPKPHSGEPVSDVNGFEDSTLDFYFQNISTIHPDTALAVAKEFIALSEAKGNGKSATEGYLFLGKVHLLKSQNDSALLAYVKAYNTGIHVDFEKYFPQISLLIAALCWELSYYGESLEYALRLKNYLEDRKFDDHLENIYNLIGLNYSSLKDYSTAEEFFNKAVSVAKAKGNNALLGVIYANLGLFNFNQQKYVQALEFYELGISLEEEHKMFKNAGRSYESLARIYLALNDPIRSEKQLNKALMLNMKAADNLGLSRSYLTFGRLNNHQKNYSRALEYLIKVEQNAGRYGFQEILLNAFEQYAISYAGIQNHQKANEYLLKYKELHQRIFSIEDISQVKKLEHELKAQKLTNELIVERIRKQRIITLLLHSVIVLALAISGLFITLYYRIRKSKRSLLQLNTEIRAQKSELEAMNTELKEAKKIAEGANTIKSHFLRNISHEIRTPLNGIIGLSDVIVDPATSEIEKFNCNSLIHSSSLQLISTIENLVDMAHITTNQLKLVNSRINVTKLVEDMRQSFQPRVDACGSAVKLASKGADKPVVYIYSDEDLLKKIMAQLIENAIKFTHKGEISIGYEIEPNAVVVFVRDTGVGISEKSQMLIYEMFRQEQESFEREFEGVGIGLSIAKSLADLIGAKLWFTSTKEIGTTFFISVPFENDVPL